MKILLAVDDSPVAAAVVRQVAKLAKCMATPPQLHVLTVVPRLSKAAEKEFGAAVLVAFGARYGLFLAEGNGDKKDFCDAAAKLKATPGDVPLFFK